MTIHALLVLDRARLRAEHAQFGRLAVALTANGCRVSTVVPDPPFGDDHPADRPIGLEAPTRYPEHVARWLRTNRQQELCEHFERSTPDLVWSAGIEGWPIAAGLAADLKRPLVIQIDGHLEARRLRKFAKRHDIAGIIAPTEPLAAFVRKSMPKSDVALIPTGIASSEREMALRTKADGGPLSMAILGTSQGSGHYRALFEALRAVRDVGPGSRFVLELPPERGQRVWQQLRRFELTDLTTTVSDPVRVQRLLAACDLILRPVPEHRVRPIVLEAMGKGTPVVTVEEPWLDYLGPEQGATLVSQPTNTQWEDALRQLILSPELRQVNGTRARETVINHHRSSTRAEAVEALFIQIVGEDPLPIG